MKRLLIFALLFAAPVCFGQGFRIGDSAPVSSSLTSPGVISTLQATINVCANPANAVPCTNKATTYTSITLGTPCSTSTQVVLAGTSTCVAQSDGKGNWGAWVAAGNYDFTVTVSTGQSFGPFTVSAGIPAGSNISPGTVAATALTVSGAATFSGLGSHSGTETFTGPIVASGLLAPSNYANSLVVCSTSSSFTYQTLSAALAALPSNGGNIQVCAGHSESLSSNVSIAKSNTHILFLGPSTIAMGVNQISIPSGTVDISIVAPFVHNSNVTSGSCSAVCFNYAGTTSAFLLGDNSNYTTNLKLIGLHVNLGGSAANTIGFNSTNVVSSKYDDLAVVGSVFNGQIGAQFTGSGAFFTGITSISNFDCNYGPVNSGTCLKFGAIANAFQILGGHANMGGSVNSSTCIDNNGGSGIYIADFDCDVAQTAIAIESTQNNSVWGFIRIDSGVTNFANFAAGSRGSWLWMNDCTRPVTDNGVAGTNSVMCPDRMQNNGRFWQQQATASSYIITDLADAFSPLTFSVGSPTTLSAQGTNDLQLNSRGGNGVSIFNNANTFKHTFTSLSTANRNVTLPDADAVGPSFLTCGTTSTCAKTNQTRLIVLNGGPLALAAGTLTITSLPFTSSTSYVCSADDSTGVNGIDVVYVSGSSVTFNGTGTDSIRYTCVGN